MKAKLFTPLNSEKKPTSGLAEFPPEAGRQNGLKFPRKAAGEPRQRRGEPNFAFTNWRCILKIARTEFCPRRAERGSGVTVQNERLRRAQ